MTIDFRCVQCGKLLRTPAEAAGKQAQCPSCGAIQPIPVASDPGPAQPAVAPAVAPAPGLASGETNPYAGAAYSLDVAPGRGLHAMGSVPTRLDLGDVLRRSWTIFRARMLACVGLIVVMLAAVFVLYGLMIGMFIAFLESPAARVPIAIAGVPVAIITLLLLLNFGIGALRVMLKIARGQEVALGDYLNTDVGLFFRFFIYVILLSLLQYLMMGVLMLPWIGVTIAEGPDALGALLYGLGQLGSYVVNAYLGVLFFLAPFLVVDQGAGPWQSLRRSVELSRGQRLMMFVIGLIAVLIAYAGVLACCVGVFFTGGYAMVVAAVTYLTIIGQPTAEQLAELPRQIPPA